MKEEDECQECLIMSGIVVAVPEVEEIESEEVDWGEDIIHEEPCDEKADVLEVGVGHEIAIVIEGFAAKDEFGESGAVKGSDRNQIEDEQQEIEGKEDADEVGEVREGAVGCRFDDCSKFDGIGGVEDAGDDAKVNEQGGEDNEGEICQWAGERHVCSFTRMNLSPVRVVRSTCPANHPACGSEAKQGDNDHSEWRTKNVGDGVESGEASVPSGSVA